MSAKFALVRGRDVVAQTELIDRSAAGARVSPTGFKTSSGGTAAYAPANTKYSNIKLTR